MFSRTACMCLALLALAGGSSAYAGTIDGGFADGAPSTGCSQSCSKYAFVAQSHSARLNIQPRSGQTYYNGEAAYADYSAPAWPYDQVQGYQIAIDVVGSNPGQNWQVVVCRPGTGGALCGGAPWNIYRGGPTSASAGAMTDPAMPMRVALEYIGTTGAPAVSTIDADATLSWAEIDNQAPTLTLGSDAGALTNGAVFNAAQSTDHQMTAEVADATDNTAVGSASITVDGVNHTLGVDTLGGVAVSNGRHSVTGQACDIANPPNCNTSSASFTLDSGIPEVKLQPPAVATTPKPQLTLTAKDPLIDGFATGIGRVGVKIGDRPGIVDVRKTADTYQLQLKETLTEGHYPLVAQATDGAGNSGDSGDSQDLIVDLNPPTAAPSQPAPSSKLATSPTLISALVSDSVGVASATLELDGLTVDGALSDTDVSYTPEEALCPGTHLVRATATDAAGRTAEASWQFGVQGRPDEECRRKACETAKKARLQAHSAVRFDRSRITYSRRKLRHAHGSAHRRYRALVTRWRKELTRDLKQYRHTLGVVSFRCAHIK
jgi:hypothetical protein